MNETHEIISALGDASQINLVDLVIHFEQEGRTSSHHSELSLQVPIDATSTESEVIAAALNEIGSAGLEAIRLHHLTSFGLQREREESTSIYFRSLADIKEDKHHERRDARMAAINGGFTFNSKTVQSDIESRLAITGAVLRAQAAIADGSQAALDAFAAGLSGGWLAEDDTVAASTAQEMVDMGIALQVHYGTCHAISETIKASINSAVTIAAVMAIDVTAGY